VQPIIFIALSYINTSYRLKAKYYICVSFVTSFYLVKYGPRHNKTNIMGLRPAWIQTSLRIRVGFVVTRLNLLCYCNLLHQGRPVANVEGTCGSILLPNILYHCIVTVFTCMYMYMSFFGNKICLNQIRYVY
jgi:hypothetical protein